MFIRQPGQFHLFTGCQAQEGIIRDCVIRSLSKSTIRDEFSELGSVDNVEWQFEFLKIHRLPFGSAVVVFVSF
jgi:hypothetical protein